MTRTLTGMIAAQAALALIGAGPLASQQAAGGTTPPAAAGTRARARAAGAAATSGSAAPTSRSALTSAPADSTPRFSGVIGVAIDSVHGGPLVGATVSVAGTERRGVTDSAGQFRIDSVPPGEYRLGLAHAELDTLGLAIATQPIAMPAGRYAVVRLATPSSGALLALYCPKEKLIAGPGAVIGRVLDADTDAPDTGARVVLYWNQLEVGAAVGVRRVSRVREAKVDDNGMFRICGVPSNLQGLLRASLRTSATADVQVNSQGELLSLAELHLASPDSIAPVAAATPAAAGPSSGVTGLRRGHAMVSGRITDQLGHAMAGADISVQGAASTTTSLEDGTYTLRGLPAGTQALVVRKVGFSPTRVAVDLSNRVPRHTDVRLVPAPPQLATVTVEGKRDRGLRNVGFSTRQRAGLGHFLTEDQIAERGPTQMTDLFTTMPGIHVDYSSGYPVLTSSRDATGGCVTYVIDGVPTPMPDPTDFNDYMRPDEVSAVEVYSPSEAPAQFQTGAQSSCAAIVIWTKTKVGG